MSDINYTSATADLTELAKDGGYLEELVLGVESVDARMYITEKAPDVDPVVTGLFDVGDKLFIIGPSKCRKSFFTLQLALSVASGRPFFEWDIPIPRRVLLVQYEIQPRHYHRRVRQLSWAMGINAESLADEQNRSRLDILNLRGHHIDWEEITKRAEEYDLVILDPFYKALAEAGADENSSSEVGQVLAECDRLAQKSEAAVIIVHHDAKGRAGDRAKTDRGSGSGVVGRDYDACIMLTQHQHEENAIVVETVLRNYPPIEASVVAWEDRCFILRDDLQPDKETTSSARKKAQTGPTTDDVAARGVELTTEPMESTFLKKMLADEFCIGKGKIDDAVKQLVDCGDLDRWRDGKKTMVGPQGSKPIEEDEDADELPPTDPPEGQ